jgi:hypothetical protein
LNYAKIRSEKPRERERERERDRRDDPPGHLHQKQCVSTGTQNLSTYFTFQNLLTAYYQCRKRKRNTANAGKVELAFEKELLQLEKELQNRSYRPGQSICFVVTKPKVREIFAADFRDRIVHHLLVNYLEPIWEKKFIFQSFACRNGKGTHLAIKFLKKFTRSATKNFSRPAHYLQVDISAFFMSLKKDILFRCIAENVQNPEILWLAEKIIFHNPTENFYQKGNLNLFRLVPDNKSLFKIPPGQGLPIGNLTSQFFANVYMNRLDQFIKHVLKVKYYLRYVDDLILISRDQKELSFWKKQISAFLENRLSLKLHPQKSVQQTVYHGINFVGFIIKPKYTLIRRRIVVNLREKLAEFGARPIPASPEEFAIRLENISAVINSYYGQFLHADTFNLRKSLYYKHFVVLKTYFKPADKTFSVFQLKEICVKKQLSEADFFKPIE